jgi:hypothetical protein
VLPEDPVDGVEALVVRIRGHGPPRYTPSRNDVPSRPPVP